MKLSLSLSVALVAILASTITLASPAEALIAFDGLCIGTDAELAVIEGMASAAGAKQVPQSVIAQDPAVARAGGKGFSFQRGKLRFMVVATPNGTCSILLKNIPHVEFRKSLEKNYPLARPYIDASGPQTVSLYRIVDPSVYSGGYIMLTVPKEGFGADGYMSVGFISPSAAKRFGVQPK
ncbi:hypothetical protein [Polaromonas sp.]|uniref:hypothetical protein n=1 Tax=Polaromonas sp. TaxID=1869339 RepID=UPI001A315704|nr:hypothetical protein [Burkholderiales bacterium]